MVNGAEKCFRWKEGGMLNEFRKQCTKGFTFPTGTIMWYKDDCHGGVSGSALACGECKA